MYKAGLRRCQGGWTLVEILMVFSVLAILAGILFPMFAQARRAAFQTQCASNLQQLGRAFMTYSQDWGDYWPAPGGRVGDRSYWSQSGPGGIEGYVRQRGHKSVWCCPLMPEWKSKYAPRSYTMNSYLREPADKEYSTCTSILKGIRVSDIGQSSKTILIFEGLPLTYAWENDPYYVYIYRCCNWTGVKGYYSKVLHTIDPGSPWHGKYSNYLYCDGHLQARRPGRKTTGDLSTYKEMRQWYVDKAQFERLWAAKWSKLAPYE